MNYKILISLSVIAAVVSVFLVSEATAGVLAIGFACLFGIFARIVQAEAHHRGDETKPIRTDPDKLLRQQAKERGIG